MIFQVSAVEFKLLFTLAFLHSDYNRHTYVLSGRAPGICIDVIINGGVYPTAT